MILRLSQHVILEISNELYFRNIDAEPMLHVYDFGQAYKHKHVIDADESANNRHYAYSTKLNNTIISSPAGSYYEALLGLTYANSAIDHVLHSELTSKLQFRKCRLLFTSGFGYSPELTAGITVRAYMQTDAGTVDLVSMIDTYDDSRIIPSSVLYYENMLFNAGITFEMLDVDSLYAASTDDLIEFRTLLFGQERPNIVYFEHSAYSISDLHSFKFHDLTFQNISIGIVNTQHLKMVTLDDDFYVSVVQNNRALEIGLKHSKYDPLTYFKNTLSLSEESSLDLVYDITSTQYDVDGAMINTSTVRSSNRNGQFDELRFVPDIYLSSCDHVTLQIDAIVTTTSGFRMIRTAMYNITNTEIYKTNAIELNVTSNVIKNTRLVNVNQIIEKQITPSVVRMIKPAYILAQQNSEQITVLSERHRIKIAFDADISQLKLTKLKIGTNLYNNISGDLLAFEIDAKAYFDESETYYVLDTDNTVITYGKIVRPK